MNKGLFLIYTCLLWGFSFTALHHQAISFGFLIVILLIFIIKEFPSFLSTKKVPVHIPQQKSGYWIVGALIFGVGLGLIFRWRNGLPLFPSDVILGYGLLYILIGITEELVFRGYLFSLIQKQGFWVSIIGSSIAHAGYKVFLFANAPPGYEVNLITLGGFTFLAGLCFGAMRHYSKSVFPCAVAHGAFDIVGYMDRNTLPWWIWGFSG